LLGDVLADKWAKAADRQAVTSIADSIDRLPARDPWSHGQARTQRHRILFMNLLAYLFRVDKPDRMARFLKV